MAWIQSGALAAGDRLPVEDKLAQQFGVSRQTVRQAVGELVQGGLLARKQGSGTYYLGDQPAVVTRERSRIVGVVTTYISDYIFPHIIRGIEERLSANGYSPLLYSTQNNLAKERKALENVLHRGVDALIVEATKSAYPNTNLDLYHALAAQGIPVIMIHATYPDLPAPLIEVDDAQGGYLATAHLVEQGHRRIGAVLKLDDRQGLRRMEGFMKALGQAQLVFHAEYMAFYTTEERQVIAESYADRILHLPPDQRPSAVFCYNDEIATDLVKFLREREITVPDQVSVVGFDDAPMAERGYPALTTVAHPKFDMGVRAADLVLQVLNHGIPAGFVHTYTPTVVVRASTMSVLETGVRA